MTPEGVARFFSRKGMAEGPFPTHYEPFDTLGFNPCTRTTQGVLTGGAGVQEHLGHLRQGQRVPTRGHHLPPDRAPPLLVAALVNAITQPEQFVEIGEAWPRSWALLRATRSKVQLQAWLLIKAVAVVTKRIQADEDRGKTVHHVGIPIHWGFKGVTKPGFLANTPDALCGRRQYQHAGIQNLPREGGEGLRRHRCHCNPSISNACLPPPPRRPRHAPRSRAATRGQADRCLQVHPGCKACQTACMGEA